MTLPSPACGGRCPEGGWGELWVLLLLCFLIKGQGSNSNRRAFTPLRGASYFSLLVQRKGNQKKAHPASAPTPLRDAGPLRWQDFSTIHPCIVEKRRASCTSPRAGSFLPAPSLRKGPGTSKAEQEQKHEHEHEHEQLQLQLQEQPQLQPKLELELEPEPRLELAVTAAVNLADKAPQLPNAASNDAIHAIAA